MGGLILQANGQSPPIPPSPAPVAQITTPNQVPAGAPLLLFGDQSVSSSRLAWVLISPKGPFEVLDTEKCPGGAFVVRNPTQGATYKVALVASGTGNPPFAFDFAEIPVGGSPQPNPTPTPTPPPTPPPAPVPTPTPPPQPVLTRPFFVTLVVDDSHLTLAQAFVVDSLTLKNSIASMGGHYDLVMASSAEFTRRNLNTYSSSLGFPTLVIQSMPANPAVPSKPFLAEKTVFDEVAIISRIKTLLGSQ